jgi:hypothetical protein
MRGPGFRQALVVAAGAATPVVCWPGLEQPFSTPKGWLIASSALVLLGWHAFEKPGAVRGLELPRALRLFGGLWAASFVWSGGVAPVVSPEALLLGLAGPAWGLAVARSGARSRNVLWAHAAAALLVSGVALAQTGGLDPVPLLGTVPRLKGASERLRVYSTLGNPNFVAA